MFTQMTFKEMIERAENGTLNVAVIKDYSIGFGMRFKIYDTLEDIELGINNMVSDKKLKRIKKVTLSDITDDIIILGIKFKNDKTSGKYSIVVECKELIKRYKVVDKRVKCVDNPGLFGSIISLLGRVGMEDKLIKLILDNEQC